MSQIIDAVYFINSRDRIPESNSASDFLVNFIEPIRPLHPKQMLAVKCVTIPISYYQINTTNNVVSVKETKSGIHSVFNVKIPYGNGNASTILTDLAIQLSNASPNGLTYSIVFNSSTGKATFSFTGTADSITYLSYSDDYFTADDLLGLMETKDIVINSGSSYTGGIVNFSGLADAIVQIRFMNQLSNTVFTTETGNTSVILAQIPIGQGYSFDIISYEPNILSGSAFNTPMQQLHFKITDIRSLPIDFNGKNIQFELILYHSE